MALAWDLDLRLMRLRAWSQTAALVSMRPGQERRQKPSTKEEKKPRNRRPTKKEEDKKEEAEEEGQGSRRRKTSQGGGESTLKFLDFEQGQDVLPGVDDRTPSRQ